MSGNYHTNYRLNFPMATRIPLPEPKIDPAELEQLVNATTKIPGFIAPKFCIANLKQGCYQISFKPNYYATHFHGTLRVDRGEDDLAISGDLYKHVNIFNWRTGILPRKEFTLAPSRLRRVSVLAPVWNKPKIPIYSRKQYYSYLKVTQVRDNWRDCSITLTMEEHTYNAATEQYSFSRNIKAVLKKQAGSSHKFSGSLKTSGGAYLGSFSITRVSKYFRAAKLEVDTVAGAVAPQKVTIGGKTHSFRSVFKTAGWDLRVKYDQTNIANTYTGGSVNWSKAQMHQAMRDTRRASANLDKEWLLHLLVVPENMNSGRGIMYDNLGDHHREGVASFSDDGYPSASNSNWGIAANKMQREVPAAFLRSASHEVGHGFNMIHQSAEGGADATVMTTSPGVANFLASNGDTFPDDIEFGFNAHVRHHLVHFPDMIVRPGGARWTAGHSSSVPEADQDRYWYEDDELRLTMTSKQSNIKLGEPLDVSLSLHNCTNYGITVPENITPEHLYSRITVIDSSGERTAMPAFVMKTDSVDLTNLDAGKTLDFDTTVFWGSKGFAFRNPGKHTIEMQVIWNIEGVAFGITASTDIWVDAPVSNADNEVAALLLDDEVGMWTMLGGAGHLQEANKRIDKAIKSHPKHAACQCMSKLSHGLQHSKSSSTQRRPRKAA